MKLAVRIIKMKLVIVLLVHWCLCNTFIIIFQDEAAAKKFRDITEAYEVLGNVKLKKMYDKGLYLFKLSILS